MIRTLPVTTLAAGVQATVWTPASGRRVRLIGLHISINPLQIPVTLSFKRGAAVFLECEVASVHNEYIPLPEFTEEAGVNESITVTPSLRASVSVAAFGYES